MRKRAIKAIKGLLWATGLGATVSTCLGLAGSWHWLFDLFSHFTWYYAWTLAVTAVAAGATRSWWACLGAVPGLVVNLMLLAPLYAAVPAAAHDPPPHPAIRLLHINVHTTNTQHEAVIRYINQSGADLVFLQEVNERWMAQIAATDGTYRLAAASPREDNFGIAALVAKDLRPGLTVQRVDVVDLTAGRVGLPAIEMDLRWRGQPLSVLSLHTLPPVNRRCAIARDEQLAAVIPWAHAQRGAAVLIGDLNATPWSNGYRTVLRKTRWIDSQRGRGYQPTFPADRAVKIPIDHCLHSRELVTVERRVGPGLGSDHLPLTVTLAWE